MKTFDCLDPNLALEGTYTLDASAGTGKTFAIEHLVTRLLLSGRSLDQILVVTFTRAATRELRNRIHNNLETLLEKKPPYITSLPSDEVERITQEALIRFDESQIFTIHGFCQKMLLELSVEADVDLNLQSQEKEDYRTFLVDRLTDFLQTSLNKEAYSSKQLQLLMQDCQFDKDRLIQKILRFIEDEGELPDFPSYQTSLAQFQSLYSSLPQLASETLLQLAPAFLKICDRKGKLHSQFLSQFQALASPDRFEELLACPSLFSFLTPENRSKKSFSEKELEALYKLGEKLAPLIESAMDPKHTLMRIAKEAKKKVRSALLEQELFTPDDLLLSMEKALDRPAFLSAVHRRYQAVIIDEFQDTDPHQWKIFKTLFIDQPVRSFYIVGDPKQSIYGFRSADLPTYLEAQKSMKNHYYLTTNYRSESTLMESLNLLFQKQKHFPYESLKPYPKSQDTPFSDQKKPLHFFIAEVEKKREKTWPSKAIEADYFFPFIAREIQALTKNKEATFNDFAILVKDRYQAARLKTFLTKLNIPLAAKSTEPLKETPLHLFFQTFLSTLQDPKKVRAHLAHPLYGLTHHDLKNDTSLHIKGAAFFYHLTALFQTHGLEKVLDAALHHFWIKKATLLQLLTAQGSLDDYSDFMQFSEILIEEAQKNHKTPKELLHFLNDLPTDQTAYYRRPLHDLNAVTIMTIHMSKGLEFPIVFALGLMSRYTTPQAFVRHRKKWLLTHPENPLCQAALQDEQAEKMRQLYVALTRAKKRLYVAALTDLSKTPPKNETKSPLEIFLEPLPPLQELTKAIGATHTLLSQDNPKPLSYETPHLIKPLSPLITSSLHKIASFTSLSTVSAKQAPDVLETELPKGVETGLLVHALFESIIKRQLTHPYLKKTIHELIEQNVQGTPYALYTNHLMKLIDHAFHTPLDHFCLADVPSHALYPEVEFLFTQTSKQSLKGFTDLIFFYEEAYYLIDWKTNVLPDYTFPELEEAMKQHDYFMQAHIYMEALERYLKQTQASYPLKGAYYIFLRGLPAFKSTYFVPHTTSLRKKNTI